MKDGKVKVILYGLGPIGVGVGKILTKRSWIEIVGGVDYAKDKVGKDLGELLQLERRMDITISHSLDGVLSKSQADVVIHATSSFLKQIYPQLEEIIASGINCVSSTEELFYPLTKNQELTRKIDTLAKTHSVTVVATGINPGFVMDTLPLVLTAVCENVEEIKIQRILDASTRRISLQKKIGITLDPDEFYRKIDENELGHVGLVESLQFLAANLGWKLQGIEEKVDPVVCKEDISTQFFKLKKGQVAGIKHIAKGMVGRRVALILDLRMYVGAKVPRDTVYIIGNPSFEVEIKGGTPGDIATAAILANSIDLAMKSESGLVNIKYPPIPHWITYNP